MTSNFRRYRQFSLRTLLLLTFIVAVFFGGYRMGFKSGCDERAAKQAADFEALIELIQTTIVPESWNTSQDEDALAEFRTNCFLIESSPEGSFESSEPSSLTSDDPTD